jgi:hypothetical protein
MPDTRISKIQVRRGSIADLPLLDAGEFGYATDEQRLFIGNESLTIGSGDGSNTVFTMPSTSLYPADLEAPVSYINPKVYLDGVETPGVTVSGISITFATAPANGAVVTTRFNSEVKLKTDFVVPGEETLTASSAAGTATAFRFDKTTYNAVFMNYTLKKEYTAVVTGTIQNPTVNVGDTLEINGTTVSFTSTSNLTTMISDINGAGITGITADLDGTAIRLTMSGDDLVIGLTSGATTLGFTPGTYNGIATQTGTVANATVNAAHTLTIDGTRIIINGNSLAEAIVSINDASSSVVADNDAGALRLTATAPSTDIVLTGDGTSMTDFGLTPGTIAHGGGTATVTGTITTPTPYGRHGLLVNGVEVFFTTGTTLTDVVADLTAAGIADVTFADVGTQLSITGPNAITVDGFGSALTDLGISTGTSDATVTVVGTVDSPVIAPSAITLNGNIVAFTGTDVATMASDVTAAGITGVTGSVNGANQLVLDHTVDLTIGLDEGNANNSIGISPGTNIAASSPISGTVSNPTVTVANIVINGTTVNFTGTTLADMASNIDNAGITGITAAPSANFLAITATNVDLTLAEGSNTTLATLGFSPSVTPPANNIVGSVTAPTVSAPGSMTINGVQVPFTTGPLLADVITDITAKSITDIAATLTGGNELLLTGTSVDIVLGADATTLTDLGLTAGTTSQTVQQTGTVSGPTVTLADTMVIDSTTIVLDQGTGTLADVIADINGAAVPGITAEDNGSGYLVIRKGGSGSITLANGNGTPLTALGITAGTTATSGGMRAGQMRILVDDSANVYSIDDQYNIPSSSVDVTFDGDITGDTFSITYENNESVNVTLNYTFEIWKA